MIKKIYKAVHDFISNPQGLFITLAILVFCLLRLPSLVEPDWYGDEGIYQVIGMAMNQGRVLYTQIWDNKPPVLYAIYAIFNGDLFYVKFLSLIFGALSVLIFFRLAKRLFKKNISIFASTAVFAILFGLPILEGNIANAENFMLLPVLLAFNLVLSSSEGQKFKYTFIAGLLFSFAFLTKIVAIFDFAALFVIIFTLRFFDEIPLTAKNIHRHAKKIILGLEQETVLFIGFLIPVVLTVLYFLYLQAFSDFFKASFAQNIGYVGYENFFIFPMGLLFVKLVALLFFVLMVIRFRHFFGKTGFIVIVWLIFSVFSMLFSHRPYTHYILVMLPAFCLFLGYTLDVKKLLKITLPVLLIVLWIVFEVFTLNYKKVIPYYINYFSFITNVKSLDDYQNFFDPDTTRAYALANFIKGKTAQDESVFLWSDTGQIYALANKLPPGRYIVSYHITFYNDAIAETKKAIDEKKPKFIIQTKNTDEVNNFLDNYSLKYMIDKTRIYERNP